MIEWKLTLMVTAKDKDRLLDIGYRRVTFFSESRMAQTIPVYLILRFLNF